MLLIAAVILTGCGKGGDYKKAMSMYENGQFEEAAEKFTELGDYENSQDMVMTCRYEAARTLFDAGKYEEAKKAFAELGDYENSANYVSECDYSTASSLLEAGDYEGAIAIFESIPDFKDSQEKIRSANKELMIQKYGPVLQALNGKTWLFNGGSNTILNKISFTDEEAEIAQVSYDGNGKHDNGSNTFAFTVDDKKSSSPWLTVLRWRSLTHWRGTRSNLKKTSISPLRKSMRGFRATGMFDQHSETC